MSTTMQIGLVVVAAVLLLVWWWSRRGGDSAGRAATDRIDTLTGWPPQATRVLSNRERLAFGTLVRALPEYMILAQVPIARFISVPKRNSYADWLRRLGYQCVDFAICDMAAQVIAVVELQPAAHASNDRARKRIARMTRSLKAAGIPLLTWPEMALPTVDAAREAVLALTAKAAPAATPAPAPSAAAAAAATPAVAAASARPNPFDEADRDSTQDEMIELLQPPPSTWFDELDTEPAPLNKR
jgi:hypothetical protein